MDTGRDRELWPLAPGDANNQVAANHRVAAGVNYYDISPPSFLQRLSLCGVKMPWSILDDGGERNGNQP